VDTALVLWFEVGFSALNPQILLYGMISSFAFKHGPCLHLYSEGGGEDEWFDDGGSSNCHPSALHGCLEVGRCKTIEVGEGKRAI